MKWWVELFILTMFIVLIPVICIDKFMTVCKYPEFQRQGWIMLYLLLQLIATLHHYHELERT